MYIHCSFLYFVLTISSWLACVSSYINPSNILPLDQLTKSCPSGGKPVCGYRDNQLVLFPNGCLFNKVNENTLVGEKIFRKISLQHCTTAGCEFSCLQLSKPVCARDVKTYQKQLFRNECELTKHMCKTNMEYLKINLSECLPQSNYGRSSKILPKRAQTPNRRKKPVPCTNIFKPVCGSYLGVKSSFRNECLLNAENVVFNRDWRIVNDGMCPQDYSKARRHKEKPIKPHSIKKRSFQSNFYSQYHNEVKYNADNLLDNKNEINVLQRDLYVYMPPTIHEQFLDHDLTSYQHSIPVQKAYEEILNRLTTDSPVDLPIVIEEGKGILEPITEKTSITPQPFAANKLNFNNLLDRNVAHDINQQSISLAINSLGVDDDHKFEKEVPTIDNENMEKVPTTIPTFDKTTQIPEIIHITTNKPKGFYKHEQFKRHEVMEKSVAKCTFGSSTVCASLANGTVRTFETVCDMLSANIDSNKKWTKLHVGVCEDCKYNCSRDYQPVCVSRSGLNYTMVNECYFNMAICMDKKSKWKMLRNGECERYTNIPDKYANSKPGFPYTSSYFVSETTTMPGTDSLPLTKKLLIAKPQESEKLKTNSKRDISLSDSTLAPLTTLSPYRPRTEPYIMRLVKNKSKS